MCRGWGVIISTTSLVALVALVALVVLVVLVVVVVRGGSGGGGPKVQLPSSSLTVTVTPPLP